MLKYLRIPLRGLLCLPFLLLLIVGVVLPSDGQHGILSIKSLAFIFSTLATILYIVISQQLTRNQLKIAAFLLCSLCYLVLDSIYSSFHSDTEISSILDHFKIFWITLSVASMSYYFVEENIITYDKFLKTIIYFNLGYSLFKVTLSILLVLRVIDILQFIKLTGIRIMTMEMFGGLTRIQTSVDIVTPFLLLFVLQSDRLGVNLSKNFKIFYCFISTIAIFFSFSRFLMFIAAVSVMLYWGTLSLQAIIKRLLVSIVVVALGTSAIGFDVVYNLIEKRFLSTDNAESDQTRYIQVNALMEEFHKQPILGKGAGSYAPKYFRDPTSRHSYEVQWVSMLMQFGVIGILLILTPLSVIFSKFFIRPVSRTNIGFVMLFTLWLLSGFTNPFLISLTSGIVYALFLLTAIRLQLQTLPQDGIRIGTL